MQTKSLTRFMWLSIGAAIITIAIKALAYLLTGSVGLMSDALESIVNLVAAIMALMMLKIAEKPPDKNHMYGHTKAEYFSSIFEALLIVIAAISITLTAIDRILHPRPVEQVYLGIIVAGIASLINLLVAQKLLKIGKENHSILLEADGHHLLTDVWTSVGIIGGLFLVRLTDIQLFDPIIALLIAGNILFTGYKIIKESTMGLMDISLSEDELNKIQHILDKYCTHGVAYHGLRTRQSATRRFVSVHILVPGTWDVQKGHDLLEKIEKSIGSALPLTNVFTHLEPIEDPKSQDDIPIDRTSSTK